MSVQRVTSIQRFRQMTRELQQDIRRDAIADLNAGADELVQQMKAVAPKGPTGKLRESIRKEQGKKDTRVFIKAGGPLTTVEVRKGSGVGYDYSRAVEFGTEGANAHPFFWPSWRLRKKKIRARLKRKVVSNIKKRSAA